MKKLLLLFALALFGQVSIHAQVVEGNLDINNLSIKASIPGRLFQPYNAEGIGSEMPIGSGVTSMFRYNIWMGGVDSNNNLRMIADTYDSIWGSGPLTADGTANLNPESAVAFDRVWEVNRGQVDLHIAYFTSLLNGTNQTEFPDGYEMPEVFLSWPAHGNLELNEDFNLAPYVDYNGNLFYDPENGDYPLFCGDECIFFIINDRHVFPNDMVSMGLEIHGMMYAFNSSTDAMLQNTVFVNYKIINRSSITLLDSYFGTWADFDIGTPFDDYVGTHVQQATIYGYNGDDFDEASGFTSGYLEDLPMMGVSFLAGLKADEDGEDNPLPDFDVVYDTYSYGPFAYGYEDGIADNERLGLSSSLYYDINGSFINGSPVIGPNYYNYMQALFMDGQEAYYGDGVVSDYAFPGDSDPLFLATSNSDINDFTEISLANTPGDRRMIGSCGPVTIAPNEINEVDLAFVFAQTSEDINTPLQDIFNSRLIETKLYFNDYLANGQCTEDIILSSDELPFSEIQLSVFPNPSNGVLNIRVYDKERMNAAVILDMAGKKVVEWTLQNGVNTFDLSQLSAGIYTLVSGTKTVRFVIQ